MVYLAQSELNIEAPHLLKRLTGQSQSQASFWRMAQSGTSQLEALPEVVYCMADGSMLFTDEGWQEVKVGRLFIDQRHSQHAPGHPRIGASHYRALPGFGGQVRCTAPGYAGLGRRLVCLSDGTPWLKHYFQTRLPEATLILDFRHVLEKLATIGRVCLRDEAGRKSWLEEESKLLRERALEQVKANLQALSNNPDQPAEKSTEF